MTPVDRARAVFSDIGARHKLAIEWDNSASVELACWIRKQPGLDWDLWLNLQNEDEVGIQHDLFTAEWFPITDPTEEAAFVAVVDGLISGDVRLRCMYSGHGGLPCRVDLEQISEATWRLLFTYHRGLYVGRAELIEAVRNGHPTEAL
ncbi:MAG TPA: hypothetical protein VGG92_16990 [Caulobacteraceae bacterium]|jgi:hypothetical protein